MRRLLVVVGTLMFTYSMGAGVIFDQAGVVTPMSDGTHASRTFYKLSVAPFDLPWAPWTAEAELTPLPAEMRWRSHIGDIDRAKVLDGVAEVELGVAVSGEELPLTPSAGFAAPGTVTAVANAHHAVADFLEVEVEEVSGHKVMVSLFGHGSSAGLANGLYLLERTTGSFVKEGLRVGVTGSMGPTGLVRRIGSLQYKTAASIHVGLDILIVPMDQYQEAALLAEGSDLKVYGVRTLRGAVAILCETLGEEERDEAVVCGRVSHRLATAVAGYEGEDKSRALWVARTPAEAVALTEKIEEERQLREARRQAEELAEARTARMEAAVKAYERSLAEAARQAEWDRRREERAVSRGATRRGAEELAEEASPATDEDAVGAVDGDVAESVTGEGSAELGEESGDGLGDSLGDGVVEGEIKSGERERAARLGAGRPGAGRLGAEEFGAAGVAAGPAVSGAGPAGVAVAS